MEEIKTLRVNVKNGYDIKIGKNLLDTLGKEIANISKDSKIAVISDDTVFSLYGKRVVSLIEREGFIVKSFYFDHGEENKNLSTYEKILDFLAQNEFTRKDVVIALGGGVVGDTVGFVSATFLRGVKYIQVPTTLLSAVDSSVGGKTAVDLKAGKNLVGAFYQPSLVLIDTEIIRNLPKDIYLDGMGEVLKYAVLSKKVYELLRKENYSLQDLIYLSVDYKRAVVEEDEFESGNRKLLNLGHTPAHAIELLSEYKITHGKAVSMGLKIMLAYSLKEKRISNELYSSLIKIINEKVGDISSPFTPKQMADASKNDKKRSGNGISMVIVNGIEDLEFVKVPVDKVEEVYS